MHYLTIAPLLLLVTAALVGVFALTGAVFFWVRSEIDKFTRGVSR